MQRWTRYVAVALALVTSTALAACGDDDDGTGPSGGDELTTAETQALVEVILGGAAFTGGSFSRTAYNALQAGSAGTDPFEYSGPCAEGGTLSLSGEVVDNTDSSGNGTASFTIDLVHSDCRARASNGMLFTLNGNPNVRMQFNLTTTENTFDYDGSLNGNVRWATSDRQGTCGIDIQYEVHATASGSYSGSQSGTACGKNINQTL